MSNEEFILKCKAQNWWPAFVHNLKEQKGKTVEEYAEWLISTRGSFYMFIFEAFNWSRTGQDYWSRVDSECKDYVRQGGFY